MANKAELLIDLSISCKDAVSGKRNSLLLAGRQFFNTFSQEKAHAVGLNKPPKPGRINS